MSAQARSSNSVVIEVQNLSKSFGDARILDDVTFTLGDGEILGIIGPSGGGKTTLLRCLDLLEDHDGGMIDYVPLRLRALSGGALIDASGGGCGAGMKSVSPSVVQRHVGFVFQAFNLWDERTVLQNLCLAPWVVLGEKKHDAEARGLDLLARFGLREHANHRVWALSGGQRQRVAIIRALMMNPRVLLCDEITSALDPILAYEVLQMIRALRDDGLGMVIVTHHIDFAAKICDRIGFLGEGRLLQLDSPDRLLTAPASPEIERFLGVLRAVG